MVSGTVYIDNSRLEKAVIFIHVKGYGIARVLTVNE